MGKRKEARKAGYDSNFEKELAENELARAEFHPFSIKYIVPKVERLYKPDFIYGKFLIEAKGRFRSYTEANKYKHIAVSAAEQGYELVFLFENPDKPMPSSRKRKDGSRLTHGEWSGNMGIRWFTRETISEILNDR